jgi:murein DD-endopeptidase MepM/ murein hydrolase activator NlpD
MRFKTETITEVPSNELAGVIQDAQDGVPPPSNVTSSPDGKGTFTVVLFFPADTPATDPGPKPGGTPIGGVGVGAASAPAIPPDDPAPFASFGPAVAAAFWPVVDPGPNTGVVSFHPSTGSTVGGPGRCFFDDRAPGRHHVGVDLFGSEGDEVVACADGTIKNFYKFYNSKGRDTFALIVEHPGVVVNYGELAPDSLDENGLKIGNSVKAGQTIGRIGATGMLHFETYVPGTMQNV